MSDASTHERQGTAMSTIGIKELRSDIDAALQRVDRRRRNDRDRLRGADRCPTRAGRSAGVGHSGRGPRTRTRTTTPRGPNSCASARKSASAGRREYPRSMPSEIAPVLTTLLWSMPVCGSVRCLEHDRFHALSRHGSIDNGVRHSASCSRRSRSPRSGERSDGYRTTRSVPGGRSPSSTTPIGAHPRARCRIWRLQRPIWRSTCVSVAPTQFMSRWPLVLECRWSPGIRSCWSGPPGGLRSGRRRRVN